jgi:ATP-binding cassette subfamily F protein uup
MPGSLRPSAPRQKPDGKAQRELAQLLERLAALESEQARLHAQLADAGFYQRPLTEQQAAQTRLTALDDEIATAMTRWEALEVQLAS